MLIFEKVSLFFWKPGEKQPKFFSALPMFYYIIKYFYTLSSHRTCIWSYLELFWALSTILCKWDILWPNYINFLLYAYFLRYYTRSITLVKRGIISSLTCPKINCYDSTSLFFSLPKEFTVSIKKAIVGNSSRYCISFLIIFFYE